MKKLKIGLLREERIPTDRRVALLPSQCQEIKNQYNIEIVAQPSDVRCYTNKEYLNANIPLQEDLSDCDILIGIKEVPIHLLLANKTYLIFSHTIKKQIHNRKLLQSILKNNIRLIDYEGLVNESGERIIAFGKYAGIVGTYNGIMVFGKKHQLYQIRRAFEFASYDELKEELKKIKLPPIKIGLTGGGRVAHGAIEILELLGIKKVKPEEIILNKYSYPVFAQLHSKDYHQHKEGSEFNKTEFYQHPEQFISTFEKYTPYLDILIAGAYWNPLAPLLFTKDQMKKKDFNIKVIADITCDIGGSIPSTIRPSTIDNPVYDYNRFKGLLEAPYSDEKNITVMAIDNLPGEIPRYASEGFGKQLIDNVLEHLLKNQNNNLISTGVVTENGKLTDRYKYLQDFIK